MEIKQGMTVETLMGWGREQLRSLMALRVYRSKINRADSQAAKTTAVRLQDAFLLTPLWWPSHRIYQKFLHLSAVVRAWESLFLVSVATRYAELTYADHRHAMWNKQKIKINTTILWTQKADRQSCSCMVWNRLWCSDADMQRTSTHCIIYVWYNSPDGGYNQDPDFDDLKIL